MGRTVLLRSKTVLLIIDAVKRRSERVFNFGYIFKVNPL